MRHRLPRALGVVALCLGLASTSLAAKGGSSQDPAAAVVTAARAQLGEAYAWGGTGPDSWDCSGVIYAAWRGAGGVSSIPRVSRDMHAWALPIPLEQVLPGDLVFFGSPVTHVGMITGRTGATVTMIDAASSRGAVIERQAWKAAVVRYGRVPRPGMPPITAWTPAPQAPPATPVAAPVSPVLPAKAQTTPSTAMALAAARLARGSVGSPNPGDAAFIQQLWQRAGGPTVPSRRDAMIASGRPVALADARVGDLVVYGPPASHVGLYVGDGLMVDASRKLGMVVLRPVWTSTTLRLVRLPGA